MWRILKARRQQKYRTIRFPRRNPCCPTVFGACLGSTLHVVPMAAARARVLSRGSDLAGRRESPERPRPLPVL
jgi:hypothetical protein